MISLADQDPFSQFSLLFGRLAGENVAPEGFVPFDLACACKFEPLFGASG